MSLWNKLFGNKKSSPAPPPKSQFVPPKVPAWSSKVVVIEGDSSKENLLTNRTMIPVTVACKELFGTAHFDLHPGETKRISFNLEADVYPAGQYSYDDLKYEIGMGEKWEIRGNLGELSMVKLDA